MGRKTRVTWPQKLWQCLKLLTVLGISSSDSSKRQAVEERQYSNVLQNSFTIVTPLFSVAASKEMRKQRNEQLRPEACPSR
jgi:hypothetical protein